MQVTAPWSESAFRELLDQSGVFLVQLSAPSNSEGTSSSAGEAGFALGRIVLDEAELLTIAVDPAHQRNGFGRKLLKIFEAEASQSGARRLHLEVAATNARALALYRSRGWQEVGQRKAYYKSNDGRIDAVLMTKRLATA